MNPLFLIVKKFYLYQKERFPLFILALGLLPAILSSEGIVLRHSSIYLACLALMISLLYLFHIRVQDEERDFIHDSIHHATRPLHRGLITKNELRIIDRICILLFLVFTYKTGLPVFLFGLCLLGYSYIAGIEFFMGDKAHRYFFLYNGINILQMFLLQLLIYLLFGWRFIFTPLLLLHFFFTCIGTILFEFIRKVYLPEEEGTGNDTYTSHLGFDKALGVELGIILGNSLCFFWIVSFLTHRSWWGMITIILVLYTSITMLLLGKKRTKSSNGIMQITIISLYAFYNICIFLNALH